MRFGAPAWKRASANRPATATTENIHTGSGLHRFPSMPVTSSSNGKVFYMAARQAVIYPINDGERGYVSPRNTLIGRHRRDRWH